MRRRNLFFDRIYRMNRIRWNKKREPSNEFARFRFMVPMHSKNRKEALDEPENVRIDFQRITRSHPSPLIPLPVEGRGRRSGRLV